jgi:Trypsin
MFTSRKKYHDIALLRLDSPVEFSGKLYPACLWTNPSEEQLIEEKRTIIESCFGEVSTQSE